MLSYIYSMHTCTVLVLRALIWPQSGMSRACTYAVRVRVCCCMRRKYTFTVHQPCHYYFEWAPTIRLLSSSPLLSFSQLLARSHTHHTHWRTRQSNARPMHTHILYTAQSIIVDVVSSNHCASSAFAETCRNHVYRKT